MAGRRVPGWKRILFLLFAVLAVGWALALAGAVVLVVLGRGEVGGLVSPAVKVGVLSLCCFLAWEQGPAKDRTRPPDATPPARPRKPTRWNVVLPVGLAAAAVVVSAAFAVGSLTSWGASAKASVAHQGRQPSRFTPSVLQPWQAAQGGPTPVFTASGQGATTTIPFVLGGGALSGLMTASGQTDFRLVPVYADGSPPRPGLADCQTRCSGQAWTSPPVAGLYELRVSADYGTVWRLDLRETRSATLEFATAADPQGTRLFASGTNGQQSPVFALAGQPQPSGLLRLQGHVHVSGQAAFFLVPEGSKLDEKRDLVVRQSAGGSGAWANVQRPPGRYMLVASTVGAWSFTIGAP